MFRTDFSDVRKTPKERAAVFVPELLLVRDLKPVDEETRSVARLPEDRFREALGKLFPSVETGIAEQMITIAQNARHVEDLDPKVLVVAAYLRVRFPLGLNFEPVHQDRFMSAAVLADPLVGNLVEAIINLSESKSKDMATELKADIVTYYYILGQ